ncbi:MAG: RNA 2',3'-cyclic phosphodiesterase [Rhizomicrobium sp.]
MRLFVALAIPEPIAQCLMLIQGGVPGARWQTREQLHLSLRFIGEADGREAAMLEDALAGIEGKAFDLELHGAGQFGNRQPHTLWVSARAGEPLAQLQRKVDNAIRRVGEPRDPHKFTAHVTLARLKHPENAKVVEWLTHHALFVSPKFRVTDFQLYSSLLTDGGSIYHIERDYPLEAT